MRLISTITVINYIPVSINYRPSTGPSIVITHTDPEVQVARLNHDYLARWLKGCLRIPRRLSLIHLSNR